MTRKDETDVPDSTDAPEPKHAKQHELEYQPTTPSGNVGKGFFNFRVALVNLVWWITILIILELYTYLWLEFLLFVAVFFAVIIVYNRVYSKYCYDWAMDEPIAAQFISIVVVLLWLLCLILMFQAIVTDKAWATRHTAAAEKTRNMFRMLLAGSIFTSMIIFGLMFPKRSLCYVDP